MATTDAATIIMVVLSLSSVVSGCCNLVYMSGAWLSRRLYCV